MDPPATVFETNVPAGQLDSTAEDSTVAPTDNAPPAIAASIDAICLSTSATSQPPPSATGNIAGVAT